MSETKFRVENKFVGSGAVRKRKRQTFAAREALERKRNASKFGEVSVAVSIEASGDADIRPTGSDNENRQLCADEVIRVPETSASASKLRRFHNDNDDQAPEGDQRSWMLVDCAQLTGLIADLQCPECEGQLSFSVGDKPMGLAANMILSCGTCLYRREKYSSPKINNMNSRQNVSFEINRLAAVYSHEIGEGHSCIRKLCSVLGMHTINKKSFLNQEKTVIKSIMDINATTLDETVDKVKEAYRETFPRGRPDEADEDGSWEDDIPWVDVSFDGTWQKRGFTSHYGVGAVIDVLTGYVLDYEVLSTYCHVCTINQELVEAMTEEQEENWRQQHEPQCQKNHKGSSKAMERDAALILWRRSVERHGLRYRTMLSDGDSVAFNAVAAAQPYGPERPVTKLECLNHVHKRMGTALRKATQEQKLGGRGQGRLTKDKCARLQNYYRGAILDNLDDIDNMKNAIWASPQHSMSTDESPQHHRCPKGEASWCFYQRALAEGKPTPQHKGNVGTAITREVFRALIPIYHRMTNDALLRRVVHGKTQNANESLNNLIWVHCPKERFVGKARLTSAVAQAVSKFNRGNQHTAQVLDNLGLPVLEKTVSALEKVDRIRIASAEKKKSQRSGRQVKRRLEVARLEEAEGAVYGAGMLEDA